MFFFFDILQGFAPRISHNLNYEYEIIYIAICIYTMNVHKMHMNKAFFPKISALFCFENYIEAAQF